MSNLYSNKSEDIDFIKILLSVLRFKKVFISIFLLSTIFNVYIVSQLKKEWQGQFQIVLKNNNEQNSNESSLNSSSIVSNFISGSQDQNLETEVKILESPSVLKPIYDYVMKLEMTDNPKKVSKSYRSWFDNSVDINLLKGTSILEIGYKSNQKKYIKPVLKKISKIYQEYSGKERKKELDRSLIFLQKQLEIIKKKSLLSMNELQSFSVENNLGNIDGLPNNPIKPLSTNNLKNIPSNFADLKNLNIVESSDLRNSRFDEQFKKLSILENQLAIKSSLLTSNSQIIKNLKREITSLKKSLSRPKEILIKYRVLKRVAIRDETTLSLIESKIDSLLLQNPLDLNPWELISEPSVFGGNLKKRKIDTFSAGLVLSLIFGISASYFAQKSSGKIYSYQEILEFIDLPLLKTLKSYELSKWPQSFKLLLDGPLLKKKDEIIGIISVGNLSNSIISQIKNTLDSNQNNDSVEVVDSLYDLKKYDKKLIVFGSGFLTKDQLFSFKEEYDLCNFVFEGALFLEA